MYSLHFLHFCIFADIYYYCKGKKNVAFDIELSLLFTMQFCKSIIIL